MVPAPGRHEANRAPVTKTQYSSYALKKPVAHAILNRFAEDLRLQPLQPRTHQAYLACVRQLSERLGKSPHQAGPEEDERPWTDLLDGDADQKVRDAPDDRHRNEEEPSPAGHPAKLPLALRAPQADLPAVH